MDTQMQDGADLRVNIRYAGIDAVRGFALCVMIAYHFCYDRNILFGCDPIWDIRTSAVIWQQLSCSLFILLAGFSWTWGKKHAWRRGLLLNACGLGLSLGSYVINPSYAIWFGILTFMGCAVLLMIAVDKGASKWRPLPAMLASVALFVLTRPVGDGYVGIGARQLALPDALYSSKILTPFGLAYPGFASADYFPLLPWFFLFAGGYFLHKLWAGAKHAKRIERQPVPLLSALGRHSLLIYLVHQPICIAIAWLLYR